MTEKVPERVYISLSSEINQVTCEMFLNTCTQLVNKKVKEIYVILSTSGGTVDHGIAMYHMLCGLPCKIIMHNIGNVDSVGTIVFLAGDERYACAASRFMFHGAGVTINQVMRFEAKNLHEKLELINNSNDRMATIYTSRSNISREEIEKLFFQAVTKDPAWAKQHGITHDTRELQIPDNNPIVQLKFERQGV